MQFEILTVGMETKNKNILKLLNEKKISEEKKCFNVFVCLNNFDCFFSPVQYIAFFFSVFFAFPKEVRKINSIENC